MRRNPPPIRSGCPRRAARALLAALLAWVCLAAAAAAQAPTATPAATRLPDVDAHYNKTCITSGCHAPEPAGGMQRHVPYLEGHCLACHEDHNGTSPGLLKPGGDALCLDCHTKLEKNAAGTGLAHATDGQTCLTCHAPHRSRQRDLLRTEADLERCAKCHADFLAKSQTYPYRHQYFNPQTMCGDCHYAHQRSKEHYLRENAAETCLTCHDLPIDVKGRRLENVAAELRTKPVVHGAMEKGSCPTCHTPHGSPQPSLLVEGYPAGNYMPYERKNYALCWKCHSPDLVESPTGQGATQFRTKTENLHRLHVMQLKQGRGCLLCHEAHAGDEAHLIRQTVRFKNWVAPLEWTATPEGGTCNTPCHRPQTYTR